LQNLSGQGICYYPHGKIFLNLPEMLLGQQEIDKNRVQRLQRNNGLIFLEDLPQIDQADAEPSGKRSPDIFFADCCLDGVNLGLGLFVLRLGTIIEGLGDVILGKKSRVTVEIEFGKGRGSLGRAELGLFG
jgi:hypothetical protein